MEACEARIVIRNLGEPFSRHIEAAAVITADEAASIDDLFACLDHAGLPNEMARAAIRLRLERLKPAPPKPILFLESAEPLDAAPQAETLRADETNAQFTRSR
jgi:hypothetical protein